MIDAHYGFAVGDYQGILAEAYHVLHSNSGGGREEASLIKDKRDNSAVVLCDNNISRGTDLLAILSTEDRHAKNGISL